MSKKGPLSKIERTYIEARRFEQTAESISKELDRTEEVVVAYIQKLDSLSVKAGSQFARTNEATAMTMNASMRMDEVRNKKPKREKKNLNCVTKTRKDD